MATVKRLYEVHGQEIFRFCLRNTGNRTDAEDLTQEVFLAAATGLGRFRAESSHRTWLFRIAFHKCRGFQRLHRQTEVGLDTWHTAASMDQVDLDVLTIEHALLALEEPVRIAFNLVKVAGFTCKEAGRIVGAPEGTIKFRVHEAMHALQASLMTPSLEPKQENQYA